MKAALYLTISALLWGLNFHLLKYILSRVHFIEAGFWRYLFAVIFLALFSIKSWPTYQLIKAHISGILIVGVFGLFCFNILLFWGLKYTSSLNASLLMSLNPIVALFLSSLFFKTTVGSKQMIGAIFSIVGVLYLLSKGSFLALTQLKPSSGDFIILVATILAAFYHVWVKKYADNISNHHFTLITNLVCLISFAMVLPFSVNQHSINYPFNFWMAAIALGSVGTAITYLLWNKGVKLVGVDKAGMFMNLVPLSTAIVAVSVGEKITTVHIVAGVLIIAGLLISRKAKTMTDTASDRH